MSGEGSVIESVAIVMSCVAMVISCEGSGDLGGIDEMDTRCLMRIGPLHRGH